MNTTPLPVGALLREWRRRRRISQETLALDAGISTRHVSFLETGRSQPSREMVLRLAEQLELPLRERNRLMVAAGFAPIYPERSLDDAALAAARRAIELVLTAHEPYPAVAVDRHWNLVAGNRATDPLLTGVSPALLAPPVNVLRATLHPDGLAPRIVNFDQWRALTLRRVKRQFERTGDPMLLALHDELRSYPAPSGHEPPAPVDFDEGVLVPLRIRTDVGILAFLYTTMLFGGPNDVTLDEIAIEAFYPADAGTMNVLRRIG